MRAPSSTPRSPASSRWSNCSAAVSSNCSLTEDSSTSSSHGICSPGAIRVSALTIAFGIERRFGSFCLDFIRGGFNQAGPLWFVWVLLVFDVLAAAAYGISQRSGFAGNDRPNAVLDRPVLLATALFALSVAAYVPMTKAVDVSRWAGIGSFRIQISRTFLYLVYFIAGVAMGGRGIERGAFRVEGPLAKYWWVWGLLALVAVFAIAFPFMTGRELPLETYVVLAETMLIAVALISVFVRFARKSVPVLGSLSSNSYGIYIVHYAVIIWLQYAILRIELNAWHKVAIVFIGGVAICWSLVAGVKRIPAIRKIV